MKFSKTVALYQYVPVDELRLKLEFKKTIRRLTRCRNELNCLKKEIRVINKLLRNYSLIHSNIHPSNIRAQVSTLLQKHLAKDSLYYCPEQTSIIERWALDSDSVSLQ